MATDATLVETHDTAGHDTLVPDPQVLKEFGVTAMSIWRWDRDPELIKLEWPPPRQQGRHLSMEAAAFVRERYRARRAVQQPHANACLEPRYGTADAGLSEP
jgi:hypothetical protein